MQIFIRGLNLLIEEGPAELVKQSYDRFIASLLPDAQAEYNEVRVMAAKLFDYHIPWRKKHNADYESGLIESIVKNALPSDHVVIVGGGWGVTAVRSAKLVGNDGKITVFEGSKSQISKIESTIELNDMPDIVTLNHAVVGPNIRVYGDTGNADFVDPSELPECDVLELDCEGSEVDILQNLQIRPRVIIVESHGMYDSSSLDVIDGLEGLGYEIKSISLAEKSNKNFCQNNDVKIITGQIAD